MWWPRIAAVAAMVAFSIPTLETGLRVYMQSEPATALLAILGGSLLLFAIGAVIGAIGARTHMSSYLLVRIAFGDIGAGIVNIALAISLIGWFGVNVNIFVDAISEAASTYAGMELPVWLWTVIASFLMTAITFLGFKAINLFASAMSPILAIITVLLLIGALSSISIREIMSREVESGLSIGQGISAVAGAVIIGAIIMPDMTRFARHWSAAVWIALINYVIVQLLVMGSAAAAGAATGETEILQVMSSLGLGIGAVLVVILGSWGLNALNLYSTVLSVKATFPKLPRISLTICLGIAGIGAALLDPLDNLLGFLEILSIVFAPVAGILVIDYLFSDKRRYQVETLSNNRQFNFKGIVAWAIATLATLAMAADYIWPEAGDASGLPKQLYDLPSLTGMALFDAMIIAGAIYFALIQFGTRSEQVAP